MSEEKSISVEKLVLLARYLDDEFQAPCLLMCDELGRYSEWLLIKRRDLPLKGIFRISSDAAFGLGIPRGDDEVCVRRTQIGDRVGVRKDGTNASLPLYLYEAPPLNISL